MSPRNQEQNEQIRDERREQILSAALRAFAVRGFAATKVSDIIAASGISYGLVYHYFKSKEDLFYELVRRALFYAEFSLAEVNKLPLSPPEKIQQIAKVILGGIDTAKESSYYFLIVLHASIMELSVEQRDSYLAGADAPFHILVSLLVQGQQEGSVKAGDPFEYALLFFSAILGLAVYKLGMPGFHMPDPELLTSMFLVNSAPE